MVNQQPNKYIFLFGLFFILMFLFSQTLESIFQKLCCQQPKLCFPVVESPKHKE